MGGVREWVGTLHHEWSAVWLAYSTVTPASEEILIRRNYVSMHHLKTSLPVTEVEVHKP